MTQDWQKIYQAHGTEIQAPLVSALENAVNNYKIERFNTKLLNDLKLSYNLSSSDPMVLDRALKQLETEITFLTNENGHPPDSSSAVAAILAQLWWKTVKTSTLRPLKDERYGPAHNALKGWFGLRYCFELSQNAMQDSRSLLDILQNPEARRGLSTALYKRGDVEFTIKGPEASRPFYAESLDMRRELADELMSTEALRDVIESLNSVGDVEFAIEGKEAALPFYSKSLEINRKLVIELNTHQALTELRLVESKLEGLELINSEVKLPNPTGVFEHNKLLVRLALVNGVVLTTVLFLFGLMPTMI